MPYSERRSTRQYVAALVAVVALYTACRGPDEKGTAPGGQSEVIKSGIGCYIAAAPRLASGLRYDRLHRTEGDTVSPVVIMLDSTVLTPRSPRHVRRVLLPSIPDSTMWFRFW